MAIIVQVFALSTIVVVCGPVVFNVSDFDAGHFVSTLTFGLIVAYPAMMFGLVSLLATPDDERQLLSRKIQASFLMGCASLLIAMRTAYPITVIESLWNHGLDVLKHWVGLI